MRFRAGSLTRGSERRPDLAEIAVLAIEVGVGFGVGGTGLTGGVLGCFGLMACLTTSSQPLHAYFFATCTITYNFAGSISNCSVTSSPIQVNL